MFFFFFFWNWNVLLLSSDMIQQGLDQNEFYSNFQIRFYHINMLLGVDSWLYRTGHILVIHDHVTREFLYSAKNNWYSCIIRLLLKLMVNSSMNFLIKFTSYNRSNANASQKQIEAKRSRDRLRRHNYSFITLRLSKYRTTTNGWQSWVTADYILTSF